MGEKGTIFKCHNCDPTLRISRKELASLTVHRWETSFSRNVALPNIIKAYHVWYCEDSFVYFLKERHDIPRTSNKHSSRYLVCASRMTKILIFSFSFLVGLIHGDFDQFERNKVLNEFRKGEYPILVATDVAGTHMLLWRIYIKRTRAVDFYKLCRFLCIAETCYNTKLFNTFPIIQSYLKAQVIIVRREKEVYCHPAERFCGMQFFWDGFGRRFQIQMFNISEIRGIGSLECLRT